MLHKETFSADIWRYHDVVVTEMPGHDVPSSLTRTCFPPYFTKRKNLLNSYLLSWGTKSSLKGSTLKRKGFAFFPLTADFIEKGGKDKKKKNSNS